MPGFRIDNAQVTEFEDCGLLFLTLRVAKRQARSWIQAEAAGSGMHNLHVIERPLLRQDVAANAGSLAGSIRETGKAAVCPNSDPALAEIAKLLEAHPGMKVFVVGHTDDAGTFDHNLTLSRDRAHVVTNALVKAYGAGASRLRPFGAGPTTLVASNRSEEGGAKNPRIEIVEQ